MDKEAEALKKAAKERLENLLADLEEARRWANADVSGWDRATATGALIRKREAEDQVAMLAAGYRAAIENSFVKVFVTGARADEFASKVASQGGVTVDGSTMYREFTKNVEPSLDHKQRQFTTTQIILLIQVLQNYMRKRNVYSLAQPKLDAADMDVQHPTTEDVVNTVRKSIRNTNGDDLLVLDLTETVLDKSLEKKAATLVVPVIITGVTADETQSLQKRLFASQPNVSIEATANSTDEDLIKQVNEKIQAVLAPKK